MTIHWLIEDSSLKVWTHDSDPSTDPPDQTTPREFGNPIRYPPEVLSLARIEAENSLDDLDFSRFREILMDACFEDIEKL